MSHPPELPEPVEGFAGVHTLYILTSQDYMEDIEEPLLSLLYAYADSEQVERHIKLKKEEIIEDYKENEWDNSEAEWKSPNIDDVTFEEANTLADGRKMWVYSVWVLDGPNQEAFHSSIY
jgi:hypothetical protein